MAVGDKRVRMRRISHEVPEFPCFRRSSPGSRDFYACGPIRFFTSDLQVVRYELPTIVTPRTAILRHVQLCAFPSRRQLIERHRRYLAVRVNPYNDRLTTGSYTRPAPQAIFRSSRVGPKHTSIGGSTSKGVRLFVGHEPGQGKGYMELGRVHRKEPR